jgi:hypothetical protein
MSGWFECLSIPPKDMCERLRARSFNGDEEESEEE